jgi:hypothetical protein
MSNQRRIKKLKTRRNEQVSRLRFERLECRRLLTGISVSIYLDQNQNGIFDPASDVPAANRIVYVDLDDNGQFDSGEPLAFTNDQGWTLFNGLEQGDYRVRILADQDYQRLVDPFEVNPSSTQFLGSGSRWVFEGNNGLWGLTPEGTLIFFDVQGAASPGNGPIGNPLLTTYELGGHPTDLLRLTESETWIVYQTDHRQRLAVFDSNLIRIDHFELMIDSSHRISQLTGSSGTGVFAITQTPSGQQVQRLNQNGSEILATDIDFWSEPLDYLSFLEQEQMFIGARTGHSGSVVELFSSTGHLIDSTIVSGTVQALVSDPISSRFAVATDETTYIFGVNDNSLVSLAMLAEASAPLAIYSSRLVSTDRSDHSRLIVWNANSWLPVRRNIVAGGSISDVALFDQGNLLVAVSPESIKLTEIDDLLDPSVLVTTRSDQDVFVRFGLQLTGQSPPLNIPGTSTIPAVQDTPESVDLRSTLSSYSHLPLWFALSSSPVNGTASVGPDGQLFYTPALGFTGNDPMRVSVYDGIHRAELTVIWQVSSGIQPPLEIVVEVPAFFENTSVGSQLGYVTVISPNPGDDYRVISSDPRFRVSNGRMYLEAAIDFESEPSIEIELTAFSDAFQLSLSTVVVLEVLNVLEAPRGVMLIGSSVEENVAPIMVGQLIVIDPDAEGLYEFTVNDHRFNVVGDELWLIEPLVYSTGTQINLIATVTDRNHADLSASSPIAVSVIPNTQQTPQLLLSSSEVPETTFGAVVGRLTAVGLGDGPLHYLVSDHRFEVVEGVLKLSDEWSLDRQVELTIAITVSVTNQSGFTITSIFPLTVIPPRSPWQNPLNPTDVNGDGRVSALDVLMIINHLNEHGSGPITFPFGGGGQGGNTGGGGNPGGGAGEPPPFFPDVNGDGRITALDALLIINELNDAAGSNSPPSGDGEDPSNTGDAPGDLLPEGEWSPVYSRTVWPTMLTLDTSEQEKKQNAELDAELEVLLEQLARQRIF